MVQKYESQRKKLEEKDTDTADERPNF